MAFTKSFIDPNTHAAGNYWDVFSMTLDPIANTTSFILGCFVNESAKLAGADPLMAINFNDVSGQLTKAECLNEVLARSEFSDAVTI